MNIKKQKKILFADDDDAFRFTIQEYFNDSPWILEFAENGVVALNKSLANKYDLIVLDINMPFMKGTETVQQIKEKWPDSKVIAYTALVSHDIIKQYYKNGFDDVISKHVDLHLLNTILIHHLKEADAVLPSVIQNAPIEKSVLNTSNDNPHSSMSDSSQSLTEYLINRIEHLEKEKNELLREVIQLKQKLNNK